MSSIPELSERERLGGRETERAYLRLLKGGVVDSPRDLWDSDAEQKQAYLERYAQPWWEALQARLAEDGIQGKPYLGGNPMYAEHGWEWTVARFELVRPGWHGDFRWNLATPKSRRRRDLRAAYGKTLTRARRKQRLRLARRGWLLTTPAIVRELGEWLGALLDRSS